MSKPIAIFGCVIAAIGAATFLYAVTFNSPYPGYSGGGMAGIAGAVTVMIGIAMMAIGGTVAVVSIVVSAILSRRAARRSLPPS